MHLNVSSACAVHRHRAIAALRQFLPGGTIGIGTIVFALGIGPAVQVALRVFDREGRVSKRRRAVLEARGDVGE